MKTCLLLFAAASLSLVPTVWGQEAAWERIGLEGKYVQRIAVNTDGHIFAGTEYGGGVFRSVDNGATWSLVKKNTTVADPPYEDKELWPVEIACLDGQVYISLFKRPGIGGGVFRSTDNGDNWTEVAGLNFDVRAFIRNANGIIFTATTTAGVWRSLDDGENWLRSSYGLGSTDVRVLAIDLNGDILAGTGNKGPFISTDGGDNWAPFNEGINHLYVEAFAFTEEYYFVAISGGGVHRRLKVGGNGKWWETSSGIPSYAMEMDLLIRDEILYFASSSGIYYSTDLGKNWLPTNNGLTNLSIHELAINADGEILAATEDGIFKMKPSIVAVEEENSVLRYFALEQNYPNPFNPSTNIRYELPREMRVTLVIYNILGQEVRTLINARQYAGSHTVKWDGRDKYGHPARSGVYLYRLQAGEFVAVRKMVLMR